MLMQELTLFHRVRPVPINVGPSEATGTVILPILPRTSIFQVENYLEDLLSVPLSCDKNRKSQKKDGRRGKKVNLRLPAFYNEIWFI